MAATDRVEFNDVITLYVSLTANLTKDRVALDKCAERHLEVFSKEYVQQHLPSLLRNTVVTINKNTKS